MISAAVEVVALLFIFDYNAALVPNGIFDNPSNDDKEDQSNVSRFLYHSLGKFSSKTIIKVRSRLVPTEKEGL